MIKKDTIVETIALKKGEIKLGESGFSLGCSEGHAIKILKSESCAIDANIILITEEKRPDLWSSCYRCKAEFYKLDTSKMANEIKNDKMYDTKIVKERVSKDRTKNVAIIFGSAVVGIFLGILLTN